VPIFQDDYVDTYAAHDERDGESNCPHGAKGMCMSRICQILCCVVKLVFAANNYTSRVIRTRLNVFSSLLEKQVP
jgi:hypothetical protein